MNDALISPLAKAKKDKALLLSIVIPVKNEGKNIAWVIEELKGESLLPPIFEIIIVDDNSTDNTKKVLEKYLETQKKHIRIKIIKNKKSMGCHQAFLQGAKKAKGKYIAFMPGDGQCPSQGMGLLFRYIQLGKDRPTKTDYKMNKVAFPLEKRTILAISGKRKTGFDGFIRDFSRKLYNLTLRAIFQIKLDDIDGPAIFFAPCLFLTQKKLRAKSVFLGAQIFLEIIKTADLIAIDGDITQIDVPHRKRFKGRSRHNIFGEAICIIKDICRYIKQRNQGDYYENL